MTGCSDRTITYRTRYRFHGGEELLDQGEIVPYTGKQNKQVLGSLHWNENLTLKNLEVMQTSKFESECSLFLRTGCPHLELTRTFSCFSTLTSCTNNPPNAELSPCIPVTARSLGYNQHSSSLSQHGSKIDLEHRSSAVFQYNDRLSYEVCFRGGRGSARLGRKCEPRKKCEGVRQKVRRSAKEFDKKCEVRLCSTVGYQKLPLWGHSGWESENPVLMMMDDMANRVWHGGNGALTQRCTRDKPNRVMHSAYRKGPAMIAV